MFERIGLAMHRLRDAARRLVHDQRGVTAVEYGVIAGLIIVVCIGAITAAGTGLVANYYVPVSSAVQAAVSASR